MEFSAAGEYPAIEGRCEIYDAICLMGDYGGRNGETTAVLQYVYRHYIFKGVDEELSSMMRGIAIVEMRHHSLLGSTIVKCGGTPYIGTMREFWTGRAVSYAKDIRLALSSDIQSEKAAIDSYGRTMGCLQNESIKRLVARIIEDEKVHLRLLEDYLKKL